MAHYAKVENGFVVRVIVADSDFINSGAVGDPAAWIQTSYNTRDGVHYGQDGLPDGGIALRGNFAGIGFVYDSTNDVFYPQQPYPSWTLNTTTWNWEAPVPYPEGTKTYIWDETSKNWVEITN